MTAIFALQKARDAWRRGDTATTLHAARAAVATQPNSADGWLLIGMAANARKDFDTAERAFAKGAKFTPSGSPARVRMLVLRAEPLICLGRPADAVETVRTAVRIGIDDPHDCYLASLALSHAGLPNEAYPLAEKTTKLNPGHAEAWHIVGNNLQFIGDLEGAEAAYNRVVSLTGEHFVSAHHSLAHLKRWTVDKNHIAALEAYQCRNSREACRVGYTLFKEYEDIGDFEAAWDCLQHGARIGRSLERWNSADEAALFAAWKQHLPPERFAVRDDRRRRGPKRIFIVGLPRSGTTLVERILTSHSQVQAIGEVNTFALATRKFARSDAPGLISPEIIAAAVKADPRDIAEYYTRETAYLSDGSAYTIDKRPDNYENVGLIRLAFPDAIIIGLDRHPMDALFGAYKRLFNTGAHGWSYSLDDLADHYHNFKDLMQHWKLMLGDGFIDVSLEALIRDPEPQIRRLIAACGLSFEDACLRPHESKGAVTTASSVQVRKPINSEGMGAWKRYESQLNPLHQRLSDMGLMPKP